MSTFSSTKIEDVANQNPNLTKWYQVYIFKDKNVTKQAIQRAEKAGYKAIVLTVDAVVPGLRRKLINNPLTFPPDFPLPNFPNNFHKSHRSGLPFGSQITSQSDWEDVKWIKSLTNLPLVIKGISTIEDAVLSVRYGASAIWVSNHGGRQLDDVPASIDVLSKIAPIIKAAGIEVYVDGGFTKGSDVFKALALGADAVFIGKPILYALTIGVSIKNIMEKGYEQTKSELCIYINSIREKKVLRNYSTSLK